MIVSSKLIESVRSVSLDVPDIAKAKTFYTQVWNLNVIDENEHAIFLTGSGQDHHLLALYQAEKLAIRDVTLRVKNQDAFKTIQVLAEKAQGRVLTDVEKSTDPAGGSQLVIADPQGRIYRLVYGDQLKPITEPVADQPIRLAHVVLNSAEVDLAQQFITDVLDFKLSDRTKIMAFMNCNRDHHSIAFGDTDNNALNHIAFLMKDVDSVMRGAGRMKDANHAVEWGPGRHGPGDNVFNYFIGPFGEVIEYTAEVEQIDDTYVTGYPENWTWPKGRTDQWGMTQQPSANLKEAQKKTFFIPVQGENE